MCYFTHRLCYAIAFTHCQQTLTHRKLLRARVFSQHFYTQDLLRKQTFPRKLLHTETLTHRCFWTLLHSGALGNTLRTGAVAPAFLHTEAFAHKRLDTPKRLHSEGSTNRWFSNICIFTQAHRRLYRQHADTFAQKVLNFYSESHRYFYTDSLYKPISTFTHRIIYTQRLFTHMFLCRCSHTKSFCTQRTFAHKTYSTRKQPFRRRIFYTQNFLHTQTSDASPAQEYPASSSVFRIDTRFVQGIWTMKQKPNHGFALIWTISRCFVWEGLFGACPEQYNRNFT